MLPKASRRFWLAGSILWLALTAHARPDFDTDHPLAFFNNVANRFLHTLPADYGDLSVTNIPVYPTNRYTPAVHRLLQLAANLYDATTNRAITSYPHLPSVFRPVFRTDGINVFIAGYLEETNTSAVYFPCVDAEKLVQAPAGILIYTTNVFNAPWIIGAKKGFPNFNEFELINAIQVSRQLEFRRLNENGNADDPANVVAYTNQLFVLIVSNSIGTELWNSYSNAWDLTARPLRIVLSNEVALQITNTENLGYLYATNFVMGTNYLADGNTWTGYNTSLPKLPPASSFQLPLTNATVLEQANVIGLQSATGFVSVTSGRVVMPPAAGLYPLPRWFVNLKTRLCFALIDENADRVIDFVNLSQTQSPMDLAYELTGRTNSFPPDSSANGAWATNGLGAPFPAPPEGPSVGLWNQLLVCAGMIPFDASVYTRETSQGETFFAYNLGLTNNPGGDTNLYKTNIFYAPCSPRCTISQRISWEVNDPFVHHAVADIIDLVSTDNIYRSSGAPIVSLGTLGSLNKRYSPWGIKPGGAGMEPYNLALKDPLVHRPDRWGFPTNKSTSPDWLGRVHRGTPWQTVYLKSSEIDLPTWKSWTGNTDATDASLTLPTNDWQLASLLTSLLSTNDPRPLLSVNDPNTNAWLEVFDGLVALTNTSAFYNPNLQQAFAPIVLASNSPAVTELVTAINTTRTVNYDGSYRQIGDILSEPTLSVSSPFLFISADPADSSVSDEAYEALPSQLLPRLRPDSFGAIMRANDSVQIQFAGGDGYEYAVKTSSNLLDWTTISTNSPQGGIFQFSQPVPPDSVMRAYRSELLP